MYFSTEEKGDDLFRGVFFCNQMEQLEIVRGEEQKGQHAAEGRGAGVKPRPLPMNQLLYLMYFLFGKKALYSAAFQQHGVTGQ